MLNKQLTPKQEVFVREYLIDYYPEEHRMTIIHNA